MNRKLARDLQAWEAGWLSAEELVARHPSDAAQVRRLTGLFSEIRALADAPVPEAMKGWNEVRSRMAAHVAKEPVPLFDRLSPRLHRRLVMGLAAALLAVPPVALAAADETVRDQVTDFVLGIDDIPFFAGGEPPGTESTNGEFDVTDGDTGGRTSNAREAQPTSGSSSRAGSIEPQGSGSGPLSGKDGKNVTATGTGSGTQASGTAQDGLAGSEGGGGEPGQSGSGVAGQSVDGKDAESPDASPSPTPTDNDSDSEDSPDSPDSP